MNRRSERTQRGSFAVELVVLTPALMLCTLLVVHHGRVAALTSKVSHAADSAARAASLVSGSRQEHEAARVARADLSGSGAGCLSPSVRLRHSASGGDRFVTVRVSCTVDSAGLGLLGARSVTVTRESTEQIDVYVSRD